MSETATITQKYRITSTVVQTNMRTHRFEQK